ncbi:MULTISPECIES: urea amidolyase family protein [unclassified Pseudomonas]|uniref:5-oxoprolinase subunit B/C family protein n=1 Tax=unclassified Pseudomonas TaxID=196821 RepID=UPI000BD8E431|nr:MULTISPECIES: urea amidolyase family protein [unclassified Pseudomonas]PVZ15565.1 KipI family sensor histidine kinase inhibitor [Pseudomonas sp. URIL14HWK12:I12]PVZ24939.1 KipI family sensor histidine kinase inhibitor [Pseudomonas sp. URIL14HWK12:I10]PVZ34785.1 KipI family sensor histidine kinase inhibitor [Pseudomonas sp. URIL14HWK12:I11]SNZ09291.1 sensor histidine kinase inhibitor, KipI family [Pseudomonas sp. URIL14HWK12:I9]
MHFYPVNFDALLVELENLDQTLAAFDALLAAPIEGVEEIVPAARTLLVYFRPAAITREALATRIAHLDLHSQGRAAGKQVEIPVHYQGEDLEEVAALLHLSVPELIRRHTGSDYSVAFCGFAPGFAYLSGGAGFEVPRRPSPRMRIPAGAVALAGAFSGIYPKASPGGWQLIGVTPLDMWDLARDEPALLKPGYRVRFRDAGPQVAVGAAPLPAKHASAPQPPPEGPYLEVLAPGMQALWQDLGRPGRAGEGVSQSGALDRGALRAANRAVGNEPAAGCLEILLGAFEAQCHGGALLAVTGAECKVEVTSSDGVTRLPALYQPFQLDNGDRLVIHAPTAGLRSYLAARGGFQVTPVLGSVATDTLAQVGPPALARGDQLAIRPRTAGQAASVDQAPAFEPPRPGSTVVLDVVPGPRADWFTAQALGTLATQAWRVTPQSSRVGIRLEGAVPLERQVPGELPSEGTAVGAIQVPANGQPVLFLADHPLTGGYPVIGMVANHHLDLAGQIPVGATLRFNVLGAFEPVRPSLQDAE